VLRYLVFEAFSVFTLVARALLKQPFFAVAAAVHDGALDAHCVGEDGQDDYGDWLEVVGAARSSRVGGLKVE
jgi:hypothetical protein